MPRKGLTDNEKNAAIMLKDSMSWRKIAKHLGKPKSTVSDFLRSYQNNEDVFNGESVPRILIVDIETSPIKGAVWSLWKQNVGLNQIENDWFILSYSAKWHGDDPENTYYNDLQGYVDEEDDTELLDELWSLLDEADIVVTQNGIEFDTKKINARFVINGYPPPSHYKQVDTLQIAKKKFGFTSNKLEYMTDKLCKKYKKLSHGSFPGYTLWAECLNDNPDAWCEMKQYNTHDVLSLEELYDILKAWDSKHPNVSLYGDMNEQKCTCGSTDFKENGYYHTQVSRFQKYTCNDCGVEYRGRKNLFSKDQRDNIMVRI